MVVPPFRHLFLLVLMGWFLKANLYVFFVAGIGGLFSGIAQDVTYFVG